MISNQISKVKMAPELKKTIKELAGFVLNKEGQKTGELSITFVSEEQIKELNQQYRNKDEVTDVLSFPIDQELLGEIVIAFQVAQRQAEEYNHSLERELGYLIVHGILHILGYGHKNSQDKKSMRSKEEKYLQKFGLGRE